MSETGNGLPRTPPKAVIDALRVEVGFGCPVPDCARPYLSWHHFDPPWRVEQHHRPEGMIALCTEHAAHADGGAFTDDQLREFKKAGADNTARVQGKFNWLRRELVFVAGRFWYHETPNLVLLHGEPIIWWRRVDGLISTSIKLPGPDGWRLTMEDNVWTNLADAAQVRCPPRGRELEVTYPDGDRLNLEFTEILMTEEAEKAFGVVPPQVAFPCTVLKIELRLQRFGVDLRHKALNSAGILGVSEFMYTGHCQNGLPLPLGFDNQGI